MAAASILLYTTCVLTQQINGESSRYMILSFLPTRSQQRRQQQTSTRPLQGTAEERDTKDGRDEGTATYQPTNRATAHSVPISSNPPGETTSPRSLPCHHRPPFPKGHARSSVHQLSAPRPCRECSQAGPSTLPRAACGRDLPEATPSSSSRDPVIGIDGARVFLPGVSIG